jgi:hypothetical protein
MVPVCRERAIIASVHADEATLVPLTITDAWDAFRASLQVFAWTSEDSKAAVHPVLPRFAATFPW